MIVNIKFKKDVEGNDSGVSHSTIFAFAWRTLETTQRILCVSQKTGNVTKQKEMWGLVED